MGKYALANSKPLTVLKYNPYQVAAFDALRLRVCPKCRQTFSIEFSREESLNCPVCLVKGERAYNVMSLIAGRQGGKSRWVTLAAALELTMPGTYGWICAPTFRDQEDFLKPAFFAQIPQGWMDDGDWNASDDIFTAPNGSRVAFRSLDNPEAVRGPTLDFLVIDEACKVSPKAWEVAEPALSINRGVAMFTTTPKGRDWVYEKLWLPAQQGVPGYWAAKYASIENPIQTPAFIEKRRNTMSPEMFAQEYLADFVTFQGAIYGDLVKSCVIDGDDEIKKYLPEWPRIDASRQSVVGIDPGSDHPFAGCLVVVTDKALIVCGEYKEREKPAMLHALGLKTMVQGLNPRWGVDRSQPQMITELAQHGIYAQATEGGPGSVVAGIERVKTWMLSGQLKIIKARCPRLIEELISYRWAETEKSDGAVGKQEPYKKRDDLCDALRYALMLWPHLPQIEEVKAGRDLSKLPEKMQRDIERMMRGDRQRQKEIEEGTGDFYKTVDGSESQPYAASGMFDDFYG